MENIVEYHIVYSDIFASTIIIERASSLIIFLLTPTPQFFSYCLSTRTINNKENFVFTQNEVKGKNRKSRWVKKNTVKNESGTSPAGIKREKSKIEEWNHKNVRNVNAQWAREKWEKER